MRYLVEDLDDTAEEEIELHAADCEACAEKSSGIYDRLLEVEKEWDELIIPRP